MEPQKEEKMVSLQLSAVVHVKKQEQKTPSETVPHAEAKTIPHAAVSKPEKQAVQKRKEAAKKVEVTQTLPLHQEILKEQESNNTAIVAQVAEQTIPSVSEQSKDTTKKLEEEYLEEHLQKIVTLLQKNLYYPRMARERAIVGEVVVRFLIQENGEVQDIEIISSKSEVLSKAAMKTIESLSGIFPKPKENLLLQLPINYSLK